MRRRSRYSEQNCTDAGAPAKIASGQGGFSERRVADVADIRSAFDGFDDVEDYKCP
jgi:hypothetical protein